MPNANMTKRFIANALIELTEVKKFPKISIADICAKCGINRKTFYYHFKDKYDLLYWIFEHDCALKLERNPPQHFWEFYLKLSTYLFKRKSFYAKVFNSRDERVLKEILKGFLFRNFTRYIDQAYLAAIDRVEKESSIDFLCTTFAASLEEWLLHHSHLSPEEYVKISRFDKIAI